MPQEELEQEIHSTGFFRNKAKNIIGAATKIVQDFGGKVPQTMEELLTLPGVARKTANVVLGTAFGIASGVVVDTHVFRITHRLKLTKQKTPEKVEQDLMKLVPQDRWVSFSSSGDLVRQKNLRRAQAPLRRVPLGHYLRLSRQDAVIPGERPPGTLHPCMAAPGDFTQHVDSTGFTLSTEILTPVC